MLEARSCPIVNPPSSRRGMKAPFKSHEIERKVYNSIQGRRGEGKSGAQMGRRSGCDKRFLIPLLCIVPLIFLFQFPHSKATIPASYVEIPEKNVLEKMSSVPSCVGLKFTDPQHAGLSVCKAQECTGVVYFRYVDTSTFACAADPNILPSPCDVISCPGVSAPPAAPPPPPPGSAHGAASGSQGLPDLLMGKNLKPYEIFEYGESPVVPDEPDALGIASPVRKGLVHSQKRDKDSFNNLKALWGPHGSPNIGIPTHEFWENLILGDGYDTDSAITALPYVYQATRTSLIVEYPYTTSSAAQSSNMFDLPARGIEITSPAFAHRSIVRPDTLSVTIAYSGPIQIAENLETLANPRDALEKFLSKAENPRYLAETTLTQGDPYVTVKLSLPESQPVVIRSNQTLVLVSRGDGEEGKKPVACDPGAKTRREKVFGTIFDIYATSSDSIWRLYSSQPLILTCPYPKDVNHTATSITSETLGFQGVIRLALWSNCTSGVGKHCFGPSGAPYPSFKESSVAFSQLLDSYAPVAVKGGRVGYTVTYFFLTMCQMNLSAEGLPGGHRSMVGFQAPIVTSSATLTLPLPSILWGDERPIADVAMLRKVFKTKDSEYDLQYAWRLGVGDPYNAGKLNARLARLALVANQLNETDVRDRFLDNLEGYQALWLSGDSPNPLVYDDDMGGLVSCGCLFDSCNGKCKPKCKNAGPRNGIRSCPNLGPGAFAAGLDFGNGYYNDHHFHYGYHLYAAAVLARFRPKWAKKHREAILLMVRDVANPSSKDKWFPVFRHMDFYAGHSWAGGVFRSFANGRNQESTSEAVNCWYSIALLGDAMKDKAIRDLGMTLLAVETHGAQTYWHLPKHSEDTFDPIFSSNGVTGILWQNLAQFQTWFGLFTWAVNGIQMLPFTPISEYLLPPLWVKQQVHEFDKACFESPMCKGDGWAPLVCMARSIVDVDAALKCVSKLPHNSFSDSTAEGNGNSMTNTMHFILTRPQ
ncbi:hypothetical protein AAMO2058_001065100 [Amorphochlora amoebiformis]